MKIDGLIVIDDTWLWTGDALKQFLLLDPAWKLEADFIPRTSVFRKLAEGSQSQEWFEQPFVINNSQLELTDLNEKRPSYLISAFRYLKHGEFAVLSRKIRQKLRSPSRAA